MAPCRLLLPSVNAVRVWTRPISTAARPRFSYNNSAPRVRPIVMANVTKASFWESYEQLVLHLQTADFVAMDFEMTGVETTPWRRHTELDTCDTRYLHVKHSAESFAVWQCGVCPFKWDEPGQKFIAYPYNFYIFPRNELPLEMPSRSYFCQPASLEFLAKHRFDFNTTVYNGISYLSREQEELARVKLGLTEESQKWIKLRAECEPEIPLTRTVDVLFSEKVRVQVGQWRDGVLRSQQRWEWTNPGEGSNDWSTNSTKTQTVPINMSETDVPSGDSSYKPERPSSPTPGREKNSTGGSSASLRASYLVDILGNNQARLVKQVIRRDFQDLVAVILDQPNPDERKQVRIFFTTSKEDKLKLKAELEEENKQKQEALVFQAVGFRKVVDAIEAAGLPLIGHNCLLDLAHLHDKFLGPLPSNVVEFSASLHRHFPCILDTKYLLKTEPALREANVNKSTSLAIVYQQLCQGFSDQAGIPRRFYNGKPKITNKTLPRVKVEISSDLQRYSGGTDTGLKHEAGFDAYMTGAVFAQVCHLLQVDVATIRSLPKAAIAQFPPQNGLASYTNLLMLQNFKGQLALDLRTGNEATGDKAPRGQLPPPHRQVNRENVMLVWGNPSKIHVDILRGIVQVCLKEKRMANVDIYSLDRSSAFVEFRSAAIMENFFLAFYLTLGTPGSVDLRDIKVARFADYEQICRSPLSTETMGISADLLGLGNPEVRVARVDNHKDMEIPVASGKYQDTIVTGSGKESVQDGRSSADMLILRRKPERTHSGPSVSADTQDGRGACINLDSSKKKASSINEAKTFQSNEDVGQGSELPVPISRYGKWMKRVFDEEEVSPTPKKQKTPLNQKDTDDEGT